MSTPKTTVTRELTFEPPLPKDSGGPRFDVAAILARRRDRAKDDDAQRARVMAQPIRRDGTRDMSGLTVEEKLALLGLSAEELRAFLKGEG